MDISDCSWASTYKIWINKYNKAKRQKWEQKEWKRVIERNKPLRSGYEGSGAPHSWIDDHATHKNHNPQQGDFESSPSILEQLLYIQESWNFYSPLLRRYEKWMVSCSLSEQSAKEWIQLFLQKQYDTVTSNSSFQVCDLCAGRDIY